MTDSVTTTENTTAAPPPASVELPMMDSAQLSETKAWERQQAGDDAPTFSLKELRETKPESVGDEEKRIRAATKEQRKRRPQEEGAIQTWKIEGNGPLTLKQASESKTRSRKLLAGREYGLSPEESLRQLEPLEHLPPDKVAVVNDKGRPLPELRDDLPVSESESFMNLREAARGVKNFREAQAAEQQALLAELQANEQAQKHEEAVRAEAAARPQPQPQPQVDPVVQRERQQLAAERAAVAESARFTMQESQAVAELTKIQNWTAQNRDYIHRLMQDPRARAADPQSWAQVVQADQIARAYQQQFAQAREVRQAREIVATNQRQTQTQAQLKQWASGEDKKYNDWMKQALPHYASDEARARLGRAAMKVLKNTGLSDQEITRRWQSGELRAAGAQQVIAMAAAHLDGQDRVKEMASKRVQPPPVQRPGVYRSRGSDADASIARLERELEAAGGGNNAVRIATKLSQARRRAGLL